MADTPGADSRLAALQQAFTAARKSGSSDNSEATQMAANRRIAMRKEGSTSLSMAHGRPQDPLWYWRQSNLPFDIWGDQTGQEIRKVWELCRLLYITHPLLGSAIDIYARYPLAGMDIVCPKDPAVAEFYREMCFDDLNYEEYLVDVGREHWLVGEAFPLGGFNDLAGVFDSDQLMPPEDVDVIETPFSNEPRFQMALPYQIRKILNERAPELEYRQLVESYPEFLAFNVSDWVTFQDSSRFMIPVSGSLMHHVKRKGDTFYHRGVPILMRAFRAIAQEEMLNSAQDSISERLYTPLILARIGASANELGTTTPWIPQQGDLDQFVEDVNAALAADFRLITTHFAVQMQNVFGRESMPDLSRDYTRLEERMLQAFGLSKTLLSGASGGQTYAADALNKDLVTQLLVEYQRKIKRFFRRRCEVVAEAQGHYDFERKGGRLRPIMETVQEVDEETGDIRFVERPKLLLPELRIKAMNMGDEQKFHDFLEQLRAKGVPISQQSRLQNFDIDLAEESEASKREQVEQAVYAQEVRRETYLALKARGLPIPQDLLDDFAPRLAEDVPGTGESSEDGEEPTPMLGTDQPASTEALVPSDPEAPYENDDNGDGEGDTTRTEAPPRENRVLRQRPPESDEMRGDMPRRAMWVEASISSDDPEHDNAWIANVSDFVTMRVAASTNGDEPHDGDEGDGEDVEIKVPVVGSFRTRHLREERHLSYFYRTGELDDSE